MLSNKFVEINVDHFFEFSLTIDKKPTWSEWSPWENCSHTCNGGERVRYRTCKNDTSKCNQPLTCDGSDKQIEPCNTIQCGK
jgi:hypothetical protein